RYELRTKIDDFPEQVNLAPGVSHRMQHASEIGLGRGQPVLMIEDARMRRHQLGVETGGLALGIAGPSQSSSPGEFHPQALTEPDGSLATHPALITRPGPPLPAKFLPIAGLTRRDD